MGGEEEGKTGEENKEGETKGDMGGTVTDPRAAHTLDATYEGFANTPALYLRNALVNEFFGDMIKQRIIAIEFMGEKGFDTHKELAAAAGFLTSGLATSEKTNADAWFSGLVGELDEASLKELKKADPISFPGWI